MACFSLRLLILFLARIPRWFGWVQTGCFLLSGFGLMEEIGVICIDTLLNYRLYQCTVDHRFFSLKSPARGILVGTVSGSCA